MAMRKHCTMSELLALKEGQGSAFTREHVDGCSFCRRELELVHGRVAALRALPAMRPPRDRWAVIREQAAHEQRGRRLRRAGWGVLALAASVTVIVGVRALDSGPDAYPAAEVALTPELTDLVARSRELEAALRTWGTDGRVLNARAAGIIADLEDRIDFVDAGIIQASGRRESRDDLVNLWRTRVDLMDALVSAHVTRAAYVGF
jgi:hypothetical protein